MPRRNHLDPQLRATPVPSGSAVVVDCGAPSDRALLGSTSAVHATRRTSMCARSPLAHDAHYRRRRFLPPPVWAHVNRAAGHRPESRSGHTSFVLKPLGERSCRTVCISIRWRRNCAGLDRQLRRKPMRYLDQHYLAEHNRRYAARRGGGSRCSSPATPDGAATGRSLLAGGRTRGQSRYWIPVRYQNRLLQLDIGRADPGYRRRVGCWCGKTCSRGSGDSLSRSLSGVPRMEGGF